jgi:hypothetical protein
MDTAEGPETTAPPDVILSSEPAQAKQARPTPARATLPLLLLSRISKCRKMLDAEPNLVKRVEDQPSVTAARK